MAQHPGVIKVWSREFPNGDPQRVTATKHDMDLLLIVS